MEVKLVFSPPNIFHFLYEKVFGNVLMFTPVLKEPIGTQILSSHPQNNTMDIKIGFENKMHLYATQL